MPEPRAFHIGDILSITTGKLLSPDHMGGIYDILNFMTGESCYTHQLGAASDECKPELLRQHPQLAEIDASKVTAENWRQWLDEVQEKYGEHLPVKPLAEREPKYDTPIADLIEKVGDPTKIHVLDLSDESGG